VPPVPPVPPAAEGRGPVEPGRWPSDPATATTPVALDPEDVARLAASAADLPELDARTTVCRACPRLVDWRETVAVERRLAFRDERYWGRPVPSWGPSDARVLLVGLAPAAHGGNRTGRIFTGDRSGDFIFAALHRSGLAAQPTSVRAGDGQRLIATRIVAPVHCAPPANKPTPAERDACRPWLVRDLQLLAPTVRSVVALGGYAWQALWPALARAGFDGLPPRRPTFGHGVRVDLGSGDGGGVAVFGCYHPSQQNTFTGKLTPAMVNDVLARAAGHAGL
jgi:uracil-DNA glycosylase family 4